MGLPRSTYYDTPATEADTEIVARITAICEEFEAYGYRRVGAELRHQGIVVNGKKIRRLMRQHDLQPKRRRRFIATTDSDHDSPIVLQPRQGRYGRQAEPALGRRHHLRRDRRWLRLCRRHPRCVVTPRRWLCHQPLDRYAAHLGSAQGRCPVTTAAKGLYPPFGSRIARRVQSVVATLWHRRLL